jgi:hypothetical protein
LRDRHETDRAGTVRRAEPLDDPEARRPVAPRGERLGDHQFAIVGGAGLSGIDEIAVAVAAVGRLQPAAVAGAAIDADDAV